MASVKQFPGSKYWYACFTLPGGKRRQISTGLTDRDEALQFALKMEGTARGASKRGRLPERQARKILQEIAGSLGGEVLVGESLRAYFERYLAVERKEPQRSKQRRRQVLEMFRDHLEDRADEPIDYVEPRDVMEWRDKLLKEGRSPNTVNMLLSYVNTAMKDAKIEGLIQANPCEGTRLKGAKGKSAKRKPFTREQFGKLLEKTGGEWHTLILLAGLTGQRKQDIAELEWQQVDFGRGLIVFRRSKNRDELEVPMHSRVEKRLREVFRQDPKGKVLPDMAAKPLTGRESISDLFRNEILPKIDIKQRYGGAEGVGRKLAPYSFHSFRHSFSTWLKAAGAGEDDRMRIVGHDDKQVSRNYTHAELEAARKLVEGIG